MLVALTTLIPGVGCSPAPSGQRQPGMQGLPVRPPQESVRPRPILYLDVEGQEGKRRLVTAAVLPDGRRLGALVPTAGAVWGPDGRWFVHCEGEKALVLTNLQKQSAAVLSAGAGESINCAGRQSPWSPDGQRIAVIVAGVGAVGKEGSIVVLDVASRNILGRHKLPVGDFWPGGSPIKFGWSPDGRKLLLSWETTLVMDAVTGATQRLADKPILAEWVPDSAGIYYFDNFPLSGNFYIRKLGSERPIKLMDERGLANLGFGFTQEIHIHLSPSGSRLAVAAGSMRGPVRRIYIYDTRGGEAVSLDKPFKSLHTTDVIIALAWGPVEDTLAVMSFDVAQASREGVPDLKIRLVNLATDEWRTLSTLAFRPRMADELIVLYEFRALSWAQ